MERLCDLLFELSNEVRLRILLEVRYRLKATTEGTTWSRLCLSRVIHVFNKSPGLPVSPWLKSRAVENFNPAAALSTWAERFRARKTSRSIEIRICFMYLWITRFSFVLISTLLESFWFQNPGIKFQYFQGFNFLDKYLVPSKKGAKFVSLIYIFYRI